MTGRVCRHPLRLADRGPAWLTCDTCQADFPHLTSKCPGLGTPECADRCMGGADPVTTALDTLYALPAAEEPR